MKADRFFVALAVTCLFATLAFWAGLIYVALHFIGKFW